MKPRMRRRRDGSWAFPWWAFWARLTPEGIDVLVIMVGVAMVVALMLKV